MPLITDPTSPFAITAALAAAALLVMQARGGGSSVARALVPVHVRRTLKNYRSLRRRRR
jgi:hypothetical protein